MISELNLESGLLSEGTNQLGVNNNVGNITLLESDTILAELTVQLLHHIIGHVWFQIENLVKENSINEISNVFFHFSG